MFGEKIIPLSGMNVDVHESLMTADVARFIKNLVYEITDKSTSTTTRGGQTGVFKPLQSNEKYVGDFILPEGENASMGAFSFRETKEIFVFVWNSNKKYTIYRINGSTATIDIIVHDALFNFILSPENFIHIGGCWLDVYYVTDPDTKQQVRRSFLLFTDGVNPQRSIAVEDSIATNGFDASLFPYFNGTYNRSMLFNMGVATPKDCIEIIEVPVTPTSVSENNQLLFNTWQFRLRYIDVWGRPSEYGVISDEYIPGINDCVASSSSLPRCVDLIFNAPSPQINQVEIAYRNCNDQQWYTSDVLNLYVGSQYGEWWLRSRNPKVNYNAITGKITYRFCAEKDCRPIAPTLTDRIQNPLPRTSVAVTQIGSFIALINNKSGFFPYSQELKDKIHINVTPPQAQPSTANNFRNITIWIEIFNPFRLRNEPIYRMDLNGTKHYGFGAHNTDHQYRSFFAYGQYFSNPEQKGFCGYLAGTGVFAISKQFMLSPGGALTEVTDFDTITPVNPVTGVKYFQQFEFTNVPKGIWVFRLAAHQSDPSSDANYQKTSTYTAGTYAFDYTNLANPVNNAVVVNEAKELIVNVCNDNYDSLQDNKILVVYDLNGKTATVEAGYIYNTNDTTKTQVGIELLRIDAGASSHKSNFTDHNGFYFVGSFTNRFRFQFFGYCGCKFIELGNGRAGTSNQLFTDNYYLNLDNQTPCHDYENQPCNFILIKGKIVLCNSTIGVPNITVVLARGSTATTDANGNFTIIAHDDAYNSFGISNPINPRVDNIYVLPGVCAFTDCNGDCLAPVQVVITKCTQCSDRIVQVNDIAVLFKTARGPLSGVTRPVGFAGFDFLGRTTFIQPLGNMTTPSVQETHLFAPSTVSGTIDADAIFPEETEYISFWVGPPAGISSYITWIIDKVEFIDNTGLVNDAAPTQIKIWYASLIEYNKQNNFNTTVNWQFIDEKTSQPVVTDKVQFLLNGDGTFFNKSITSLVKYAKDGQYFLINYTNDLANLKQNAIIRIIRPKSCTTTEPYFEVCSTINIIDRKAERNAFELNFFDTYYVYRQIPVPVTVGDETINELRIFGVPFEHDSPSDFWGKGCQNIGRVNIENPYESEIYLPEQFMISGIFGLINFTNFFDESNAVNFTDTPVNGIVAVLPETSTILVIGQNDNFVVGYNDNLIRINQDGTAQSGSLQNGFGKPQRKVGANFGCQLFDKNTIYKNEGIVTFIDSSKSALISHNYQFGTPISMNGADSLVRAKIKAVQEYNLLNGSKRYFTGVINPINMEYLLTDFILGSNNYINDSREFDVTKQETISFDLLSKAFKAAYSFTPELYTELEGEKDDQQLFTLRKGIPYRHYSVNNVTSYNTFYGVKCERVLEIVIVLDNLKKKKPLSIAEYCKQCVYFADRVLTETGQVSRILIAYFQQAEFGWYAPFLCDLNTPFDPNLPRQTGVNNLLDGNMLVGTWIKVRLIGDPAFNDIYSEFQGVVVNVMPSEPSGVKQ